MAERESTPTAEELDFQLDPHKTVLRRVGSKLAGAQRIDRELKLAPSHDVYVTYRGGDDMIPFPHATIRLVPFEGHEVSGIAEMFVHTPSDTAPRAADSVPEDMIELRALLAHEEEFADRRSGRPAPFAVLEAKGHDGVAVRFVIAPAFDRFVMPGEALELDSRFFGGLHDPEWAAILEQPDAPRIDSETFEALFIAARDYHLASQAQPYAYGEPDQVA